MAKFLFVFLAFLNAVSAFAQDSALLDFILANEDACVQAYEEGRIYLKPEQIQATANGLLLIADTSVMPIHTLYSDAQGCYLKPMLKWEILNRCQGCGNSYFIRCRTPGCRYNPDTPK